jgi:hypothetical protein
MDLTKYSGSPYGEKGIARNDQQNMLSAALRGLLGQEETGSVLDPRTADLKATNSSANLASILSDLIPGKGVAGGGMALAGALRRGGRPDLFLSHGTNATSLFKDGELITELTHPSMAITKDGPTAPWGDLMLIPRAGKFDPRTSPSALHDMDAWTPSWKQNTFTNKYERGRVSPDNSELMNDAQARLFDKFGHRWGKGGLNDQGNEAMGANRFPSFEAYENATVGGAKRLEGGEPIPDTHFDYLNSLVSNPRLPYNNKPEALQGLLRGEVGGDTDKLYGRDIMKALRQSPQDYGELKAFGHVPLTADNFAGALVKQGTHQSVLDALEARGISTKTYDPWNTQPWELGEHADDLQTISRARLTPQPGSRGPGNWNPPIPYDEVIRQLREKEIKAGYTAKTPE